MSPERLAETSVLVAWSPLADLLGEQHGFESVWQQSHRVVLASAGVGDLREQWTAGRILAHRAARIGRLWARERVPEVLATRWCDVPADLTWDDLPPDLTWRDVANWHPYLEGA